jgi:hypothetical protein
VLIVCAQRTGSTWLFDVLRSCPAVDFEQTFDLCAQFGVGRFNRYPGVLLDEAVASNGHANQSASATMDVEVMPARGERIVLPQIEPEARELATQANLEQWSVEKIHPEFFDWQAARFLQHIQDYEQQNNAVVELVYRLRDPISSIRSMLAYKQRDPAWYAGLSAEAVPAFVERSYRALADLYRERPGVLSTYEGHRVQGPEESARIFRALWPEAPADTMLRLAAHAESAVERMKQARKAGNPFSGDAISTLADDSEYAQRHAEAIATTQAIYQRILTAGQTSEQASPAH